MMGIFKDAWSAFDPDATGYIKIHYFADFMFELGAPFGWDESYRKNLKRQNRSFNTIIKLPDVNEDTMLFF